MRVPFSLEVWLRFNFNHSNIWIDLSWIGLDFLQLLLSFIDEIWIEFSQFQKKAHYFGFIAELADK